MKMYPLKPTKPVKIPDMLIYRRPVVSAMKPPQEEFVIFSTTGSKNTGLLVCHKTDMKLRDDYNGSTLAIDLIKTDQHKKGFGRALIEFAKNYSRKIGCNGFICLKSDIFFTPNNIPHLFYRKCGFSTLNKKVDRKFDKFIKNNKDATYRDFPSMLMFYPAIKSDKKSFFEKLSDFFKFV